ncbi:MAG: aminodeoxychorismate synthase component I [Deltaproteobacteria bacterium]|nr:MAG: aminodeoxychorismate synthase component I [Deltaproteobacteria bacterium]
MDFLLPPTDRKLRIRELTIPALPSELFALSEAENHSFFLDSSLIDPYGLGRYSFIGSYPFLVLKSKGKSIELIYQGEIHLREGNPFNYLNTILHHFSIETDKSVPPFVGGGVGYLSYDLRHFIESLPAEAVDDLGFPDCYFAFYDQVLAYDHKKRKWLLCELNLGDKNRGGRTELLTSASLIKKRLSGVPATAELEEPWQDELESNFTREDYLRAVERALEYIRAGDIYQVNLSQRFHTRIHLPPNQLYLRLRSINPAPFSCYLNFDGITVASSSPERFLRVQGQSVETRPIKGTRPRGRTPREDKQLKKELLASKKDRAELNMIVDLERNDLGRVCDYGSVRVARHAACETYATVFHLVSTVEGKLLPGNNVIKLLKASFPGGSITGAPKIRSMEIIDELEPTARSVYTGSIGYLGFNRQADLNIAIRTILIKGREAYFQVGGGIVADSTPEGEYQETLDKGKALMQSLNIRRKDEQSRLYRREVCS